MVIHIRRREFIFTLVGAAAAWPLGARAQQLGMPVVGILAGAAPEANAIRLRAFREGLRTAGYIEGSRSNIGGRRRTPVGSRSLRQGWFAIEWPCW